MEGAIKYLLTSYEAKEIDKISIEKFGIPSFVLMERAALALSETIHKDKSVAVYSRILVVAGVGNNGADGLAAARILQELGYHHISVLVIGEKEKATEEWTLQYKILNSLDIPVVFWNQLVEEEYTDIRDSDLIIDALFGIGLHRNISGEYEKIVRNINESSAKKYAVDIPSGVCATTGKVLGCAVKANVTVTFGYMKLGLVLYPGTEYAGCIICRKIGFPQKAREMVKPQFFSYTEEALHLLPNRPMYSNKGTFGKILVIAGSPNMAGAAYFASLGAYAAGCGLVRILTHEQNRTILQTLIPEAIMTTYEADYLEETLLKDALEWADVLVMGPGLSVSDVSEKIVEYIWRFSHIPMVVDADALNVLAKHPEWWHKKNAPVVVTPHLGELGRLTNKTIDELRNNFLEEVCRIQKKLDAVIVAKDARTIVAGNEKMIYINTSGNSGMAKAGSGDVLTGIIAALLARKMCPIQAASLGVYLHGLAGDEAKESYGEYGMKPENLTEGLEKLLRKKKQDRFDKASFRWTK